MPSTTIAAIIANEHTLIQALTPTSFASRKFEAFTDVGDFTDWAEKNPAACLRRFHISDAFEYDEPIVSDLSAEELTCRMELAVAYPRDGRFGPENDLDLQDVIREDMHQIDGAIGLRGYGSYVAGHVGNWFSEHSIDAGAESWILTIGMRVNFWRQL